MAASTIESNVDKLLVVLDDDVRHIRDSLLHLNELRSAVIKRDDAALDRLLSDIQAKASSYAANEAKRQSLRKDLAKALGCNVEQMTLTRLESRLPIEKKTQVAKKKAELRTLIGELKKEHLATAMLLSDCARFNNLLLSNIFDLGKTGTVTYRANGATNRSATGGDRILVNLRL